MHKIDPSLYLTNQPVREPKPELDKEGFLKILVTQLQHQDPTDTMNSQEMIAQMTQLSSLEQITNMAKSFEMFVQSQMISPVIEYSHMIGKIVSYEKEGEDGTERLTDEVVAVSQQDGWAILEMKNGDKIYADAITEVKKSDIEDVSG